MASSRNNEKTDINILLLGQTGVGKTTFINSFVNYLTFNTLDDAMKGNLQVLIPTSFNAPDPKSETFESKTVLIGRQDSNENNISEGESKTKRCRTYVFPINKRKLRIIDVPGLADTRSFEQNGINLEHILMYINQFTHLNGICVLLKTNEARLDILFRFCVKEIITHLHRSAKDNIMFVFTSARSTFFQPGNTTPLLKRLLEELKTKNSIEIPFNRNNTFLFDNESFLFLARYKNGFVDPPDQIETFRISWNKSVIQSGNLIECVSQCVPHQVQETLSLNEAKQLITKLHRPLAEVARLIEENVQLAKNYQDNPYNYPMASRSSSPMNCIELPQYSAEVKKLDYPRTVCASQSCTDLVLIEGVQQTDYIAHCHEHCFLKGVPQEVVGHPVLQKCAAMDRKRGVCNECSCPWSAHKHITYEYRKSLTFVDLPLSLPSSRRSTLMSSDFGVTPANRAINRRIDDLRNEQTQMMSVYAKLSQFLHANSITSYNDDMEEYIKYFINEEKEKQKFGVDNRAVIRGLETTLELYKKEMKLFEDTKATNNHSSARMACAQIPRLEDIYPLIESLYALPLNGDKIRVQVEALKESQKTMVERFEQAVPLPFNKNQSSILSNLWNLFS